MVKLYQEVYRILDVCSLAKIDCGTLCGKQCCCYTVVPDLDQDESGMELMPGEEEIFPLEADWHQPRFLPSSLYCYPPEWGDKAGLIQIRCKEPCRRHERPVNCRLFPFQICRLDSGYHLALSGGEGLYHCPLLDRPDLINPDFIASAREAARLLLTIPKFRALVDWDSQAISSSAFSLLVKI